MRTGIALGSNVGDRMEHLRSARDQIMRIPRVGTPLLNSAVYETEPVGLGAGNDPFLNAVIEVEFSGHVVELLDAVQQIETAHGRLSKRPRNAPRTIDIDILYVGNLVLSNQEIVIPHPRLHQRRFVLAPLADIRPELILPGQHSTIAELLAELEEYPSAARLAELW